MKMGITLNWRIGTLCCFCFLYYFGLNCPSATAAPFKCNSASTCTALVDYKLPNTTSISAVQNLFNISNLFSILGPNSLPPSTSPKLSLPANSTLKIPFPCLCNNGTGISNKIPTYTVVPNDGLDHIATDVFSGLVTYQEIQHVNNISDPNRIFIGQVLWIPLPCSCDDVDGRKVVHYGHLVAAGSSLEGIAEQYNTSQDTLQSLNSLASPKALLAGAILDVPLRACVSSVESTSLDSPLLVTNGTYAITAGNCVRCNCDASQNWTLSCNPSQLNSSLGGSCPNMNCTGVGDLSIGNVTVQGCNRTTCTYAGYNNQTIFTTPVLDSTCPAPAPAPNGKSSSWMNSQSWKFNAAVIILQVLLLLCL